MPLRRLWGVLSGARAPCDASVSDSDSHANTNRQMKPTNVLASGNALTHSVHGKVTRTSAKGRHPAAFAYSTFTAVRKRKGGFVGKVLASSEGGIFKRIDENRELLEQLQQRAPDLLYDAPWIEGWISSQDAFLVDLAECLDGIEPLPAIRMPMADRFPRAWPIPSAQPQRFEPHPDDAAAERFCAALKSKMAINRAQDKRDYADPQCPASFLAKILIERVEAGDPLDVALIAMALHLRGERIDVCAWPEGSAANRPITMGK